MMVTAARVDAPDPISNRIGDASHGLDLAAGMRLAAAPTFAVMALLNLLASSPVNMLCSAGPGMRSLGGMTLMYALMGVFHAGPWLKLARSWRGRRAQSHIEVIPAAPR